MSAQAIEKQEDVRFSEWLAQSRKQLNMSQSQFAKSVGVSRVMISYWENGLRAPLLRLHQVQNLCKTVGVEVADIPKW